MVSVSTETRVTPAEAAIEVRGVSKSCAGGASGRGAELPAGGIAGFQFGVEEPEMAGVFESEPDWRTMVAPDLAAELYDGSELQWPE